jgi:hypothetical protein
MLLAGCASLREDGGREFEPSWPDVADLPKAQPGAIYAQGTETSLWQNVTARNIGDTLTTPSRPMVMLCAPSGMLMPGFTV